MVAPFKLAVTMTWKTLITSLKVPWMLYQARTVGQEKHRRSKLRRLMRAMIDLTMRWGQRHFPHAHIRQIWSNINSEELSRALAAPHLPWSVHAHARGHTMHTYARCGWDDAGAGDEGGGGVGAGRGVVLSVRCRSALRAWHRIPPPVSGITRQTWLTQLAD
jgi:hypothetical protein